MLLHVSTLAGDTFDVAAEGYSQALTFASQIIRHGHFDEQNRVVYPARVVSKVELVLEVGEEWP